LTGNFKALKAVHDTPCPAVKWSVNRHSNRHK